MSLKKEEKFTNKNNFLKYQNEFDIRNNKDFDIKNKKMHTIKNIIHNENQNNNFQNNEHLMNISFQNNISQNHLLSLIQVLQQENTLLRNKLTIGQKIEDKYSDTIQYKLLSSKNEIENLKKMNARKDNIIMNMQNFINNINKIITNGKINVNINQIDINEFIINLKELEKNIISKLQKIQNFNKIPQPKLNKGSENLIKMKKKAPGFKKYVNKVPIKKNLKRNITNTQSSFIKSNIFNTSINKQNFIFGNFTNNKNNECKDIRCKTCRKKSKNNENFYLQRRKLRLKGFLLTKPEGIFSRTPKKDQVKSTESDYYHDYLKNINNGKYSSYILNDDEDSFFNINK